MSPAEVGQFEPASFRDPAARVLRHDGQILRYLTSAALHDFERLSSTRFYREFTESGRLVATERTSSPQNLPLSDPWVAVLRHQTIPIVSYPYEWCFSMLQDAALLQLDLLVAALDEGMTLKDATPFNIQWFGTRPVFIDIGSFKVAEPGEPWAGYRQFCEMFLYPLFLQAYKDVPFHPWLRGSLEGVEAGHINSLMSARDRLRPGVFTHVYLLSKLQSGYEATQRNVRKDLRSAGFGVELIKHNVKRIRRIVERLTWSRARSTWSNYVHCNTYEEVDRERKKQFILRAAGSKHRSCVWDLGCNTGEYSRAVCECADLVVAVDADHLAVEHLYRELKDEQSLNILPLVGNLTDPSPGLGWRHRERQTLEKRSRPDLILALALVHHLSIGRNVPLLDLVEWFASFEADLVIEFVAPEDAMVEQLLRNRDNLDFGYTQDRFEACVANHFVIVETEVLQSGTRTIYYLRPKHSS
jgi:hypothetical protein